MKKPALYLVALFSLMALPVYAESKIAVVNVQKAILDTVASKNRLRTLRESADFMANLKERDAAYEALKELSAKAQKEGPTMSVEEKKALALKVQEKEADVKHAASKLQAAEQQLGREILLDHNEKYKAVVNNLIKEQGIGLLLTAEAVLYGNSDYDITALVTERLNAAQ